MVAAVYAAPLQATGGVQRKPEITISPGRRSLRSSGGKPFFFRRALEMPGRPIEVLKDASDEPRLFGGIDRTERFADYPSKPGTCKIRHSGRPSGVANPPAKRSSPGLGLFRLSPLPARTDPGNER